MASSEPSFDRSPPVGLPAGLVLWSSASRLAIGSREGDGGAGDERGGRDAEHQRRHLLGHQVVVAVRRVDEGRLDVVLRPVGIGQVDDVRGDGHALARRHDRLDEAVELHVRAGLRVVADVGHPDRAHPADRDLVDVLPVDVGGAVQVDGRDGRAAGVEPVQGGADDLAHRVRAVVVDPPEGTVDAGGGQARGLLDAAVGRRVAARRRPRRAREAAGRDGGRGRCGGCGRGRSDRRRRLVAGKRRRGNAGGDGERGRGAQWSARRRRAEVGRARSVHAVPRRGAGSARWPAIHPFVVGELGPSPPTVRGVSPSGRAPGWSRSSLSAKCARNAPGVARSARTSSPRPGVRPDGPEVR